MKEEIIDMRTQDMMDSFQEIQRTSKFVFKLNHTEPFTEEYFKLLNELFEGKLGKNSNISAPFQIDMAKNMKIGNHVFINHNFIAMTRGKIIIEDDVMIAPGVSILTANHDLKDHQILKCKQVHIKKNAWIGAKAIILPGITVGENAVVAAGAVVTKDVLPNTVVGGNPAKILKTIE